MEHQKCYVFQASKSSGSKKRKRKDDNDTSWQCRKRIFERLWTRQSAKIEAVLSSANEETLRRVTDFVAKARDQGDSKLSAGFITAGPNIASHTTLFKQLDSRLKEQGSNVFVALNANECPNLKSLLKTLIVKATSSSEDPEDDDQVPHAKAGKGPKLLNYDLQLLQAHVDNKSLHCVLVAFQDTEAFDGHVLSDAIDLLHLWRTRIPFVLLFGIATSTGSFQDRLSRTALRSLQGEEFDVVKANELLERAFTTIIKGDESRLWLGPEVTSIILERQKDHVQNAADFVDALKYAYMSHFFANRVSMWIDMGNDEVNLKAVSAEDLEALTMLPSFQQEIDNMLNEDNSKDSAHSAKLLLESNNVLETTVRDKVRDGHDRMRHLATVAQFLHILLSITPKANNTTVSALYARAVGARLLNSPLLREMFLFMKRVDSVMLQNVLNSINEAIDEPPSFVASTIGDLETLLKNTGADGPLRSEHDDRNTTVRTTIISKKAQLSKEKSSLSKNDEAYSKLLTDFVSNLEEYLTTTLIDPTDLCFHEIFTYDIKGPHRASFTPRTRAAVERALSAPHDYLACECCGTGDEGALSSSQPATAILYQLYLESGSLINVSDLYSAYVAIVGDEIEDEEQMKALFQRGLAELKYLGMIRQSRKKTDHIAKVAWKGL